MIWPLPWMWVHRAVLPAPWRNSTSSVYMPLSAKLSVVKTLPLRFSQTTKRIKLLKSSHHLQVSSVLQVYFSLQSIQCTSTHSEYRTCCFWASIMSCNISFSSSLISNCSLPLLYSWIRFTAGSSDTPVHQQLHGWGGRFKTSHPSLHSSCPDAPHANWIQVTFVKNLLDFKD